MLNSMFETSGDSVNTGGGLFVASPSHKGAAHGRVYSLYERLMESQVPQEREILRERLKSASEGFRTKEPLSITFEDFSDPEQRILDIDEELGRRMLTLDELDEMESELQQAIEQMESEPAGYIRLSLDRLDAERDFDEEGLLDMRTRLKESYAEAKTKVTGRQRVDLLRDYQSAMGRSQHFLEAIRSERKYAGIGISGVIQASNLPVQSRMELAVKWARGQYSRVALRPWEGVEVRHQVQAVIDEVAEQLDLESSPYRESPEYASRVDNLQFISRSSENLWRQYNEENQVGNTYTRFKNSMAEIERRRLVLPTEQEEVVFPLFRRKRLEEVV